jgi:hypothetical protein
MVDPSVWLVGVGVRGFRTATCKSSDCQKEKKKFVLSLSVLRPKFPSPRMIAEVPDGCTCSICAVILQR